MYGCVWFDEKPQHEIAVRFEVPDAGGYIHCMAQRGDRFDLTNVTEAGVHCGKFGFLESECPSWEDSIWSTTYYATTNETIPATTSGSTQTKWFHEPFGNRIQLWNQNGNVSIYGDRYPVPHGWFPTSVFTPDYETDKIYVSNGDVQCTYNLLELHLADIPSNTDCLCSEDLIWHAFKTPLTCTFPGGKTCDRYLGTIVGIHKCG